jgi:hypothetical protein
MALNGSSEQEPLWMSGRPPGAVGPTADAEGLRRAYLDMLKLAMCELVGTSTTSVGKLHADGSVTSREMDGDQLRIRSAGMDWPLHGLTMVGLNRLDDLQACVEAVVRDDVPGDLIETGVWRGGASILMRATLDSLGAGDRTVWVADSFAGFPAGEGEEDDYAAIHFLQASLEEVRANFSRLGLDHGVEFVAGFFEESMPRLAREDHTWSLVRLDGDSYDATWITLNALYPALSVGGYLVVDDYGAVPECMQAIDEFRERHGIDEPIEKADWTGARWRKTREVTADAMDVPAPPSVPLQRVERPAPGPVPTLAERELRERLAAAEAELAELRGSPLKGAREWMRGAMGRGGER